MVKLSLQYICLPLVKSKNDLRTFVKKILQGDLGLWKHIFCLYGSLKIRFVGGLVSDIKEIVYSMALIFNLLTFGKGDFLEVDKKVFHVVLGTVYLFCAFYSSQNATCMK
jgi:hypothetical protein